MLDNVALAVQAAARHGAPAAAGAPAATRGRARARRGARRDRPRRQGARAIDELSHGERRALEVGLTLASRPRLVLLDEPMAGMGHDESARMEALIRRLRAARTVLLIEHDVDAVFRLADRVSVLVSGRVIASGAPEAVRSDAACDRRLPRRGMSWPAPLHPAGEPCSRCAACMPATAAARCCSASTSRSAPARSSALLGRNGMGKTTLVRTIWACSGRAAARSSSPAGGSRAGAPHRIARRGVGLVPEGRQIFANLSVDEHLSAFERPRAAAAGDRASDGARPRGDRRRAIARVFDLFPRAGASGAATSATSSPAASSRCWRSAARWSPSRGC